MSTFRELFGAEPDVTTDAPGRANLIGEHTDYSGGFVLPVAIPQRTQVQLRRRPDDVVQVHSEQLGRTENFRLGTETPRREWVDHVQGVTALARPRTLGGFEARIDSAVPVGSGLASSAALEVALLRALREAFGWRLDDVRLALLAQRVEVEFVGAPVGVMDPMAASLGNAGEALFIDTQSLGTERVRLPDGLGVAVVHSGISHEHSTGDYRIRREECEEATRALGVSSLRSLGVEDLPRIEALPAPLDRRARHVVSENARVIEAVEALRSGALEHLGELLAASHRSLRDDYQVSVPDVDRLVSLAAAAPGVFGARLTGGGFGGAIVVAARPEGLRASMERVAERYRAQTGRTASVLLPQEG
ncbi:MAG TPA: galactokinase [Myxococcaceae bacterium]|nr:galactokinase [Myxococcaceae bacterium]